MRVVFISLVFIVCVLPLYYLAVERTAEWNSGGFGKNLGFEMIEILLVPHGGHHNDTIVTVERKFTIEMF